MKYTPNLKLKKPEGTDIVDIDDFNLNFDTLDTEILKRVEKTKKLTTSYDLNTLVNTGFYNVENPINAPSGITGWCYIISIKYSESTTYLAQILIPFGSNRMFFRRKSSTWQIWIELANKEYFINELTKKVDKISGKGLSTNDYTTTEKNKLAGISTGANNYTHPSAHSANMITENTSRRFVSDTEKAEWNTVDNKVDKISGKGLSTNDYTTTEKDKLAGIATGANKTTLSNSVTSTSTTTGASSKAVKTAYDKANHSHPYANSSHSHTKSDIGLGNVTNNEQATKTEFDEHKADYIHHAGYGTASGTNAKTITLDPIPSRYKEGMTIAFKNATQNTGAVTINVNGLGAKSVLKSNGSALSSRNLKAGSIYTIRYNGSNFILQGEGGEYGTAQTGDVLKGKTIGTEDGIKTGTMPNFGAVGSTITTQGGQVSIQRGYHSGSGSVKAQFANLVAGNIKKGINVGGIVGSYEVPPECVVKTNVSPASYAEIAGGYGVKVSGFDFIPMGAVAVSNTDKPYFILVVDRFTMKNKRSDWRTCDTIYSDSYYFSNGVAILDVPYSEVPYTVVVFK